MNLNRATGMLMVAAIAACQAPQPDQTFGDRHFELADRLPMNFQPDTVLDSLQGWRRFDAGRILMKPIVFPKYSRACEMQLEVTLRSAGDPWDKSGAIFAFADEDGPAFMDRLQEGLEADTTRFVGVMPDETGNPALELMRFLTPFGAGHFSHHPKAESWRPVYVDGWADSVSWKRDLSMLQPWFAAADTVWIGCYIDTWTPTGYEISIDLDVQESALDCNPAPRHTIVPLWNTTRYAHDQREYSGFHGSALCTNLVGIAGNVRCELITTGHGGHEGGDEFTPQEHLLHLDSIAVSSWTPWRTDCATFRRLNPSSGSWTVEYQGGEAQIASSDLSRSNWCPGSQVLPKSIDLGNWDGSEHSLALSIPGAQAYAPDAFNFWNVSAFLVVDGNK